MKKRTGFPVNLIKTYVAMPEDEAQFFANITRRMEISKAIRTAIDVWLDHHGKEVEAPTVTVREVVPAGARRGRPSLKRNVKTKIIHFRVDEVKLQALIEKSVGLGTQAAIREALMWYATTFGSDLERDNRRYEFAEVLGSVDYERVPYSVTFSILNTFASYGSLDLSKLPKWFHEELGLEKYENNSAQN